MFFERNLGCRKKLHRALASESVITYWFADYIMPKINIHGLWKWNDIQNEIRSNWNDERFLLLCIFLRHETDLMPKTALQNGFKRITIRLLEQTETRQMTRFYFFNCIPDVTPQPVHWCVVSHYNINQLWYSSTSFTSIGTKHGSTGGISIHFKHEFNINLDDFFLSQTSVQCCKMIGCFE